MKAAQRRVLFRSFGNEEFAARVPMRVRSENRNFSAYIVGGMQSAFAKYVCRHCGRGCFAMHSGDHDAALSLHDCSDGFRAAEQRFSATARGQENRVVVLNRGGKNNEVRNVRMLAEMLLIEAQPKSLQSLGLCRCNLIRAAQCVSQLDEKPGETAHTAARYTDEMN